MGDERVIMEGYGKGRIWGRKRKEWKDMGKEWEE